MARKYNRLTAVSVSKVRKPGMYCDGGGLYLQVSPAGNKSWIFRFSLNGREREMGLGSVRDIALAEARDHASAYRNLKRGGIDPIDHRMDERRKARLEAARTIKFGAAARACANSLQQEWGNAKHKKQWLKTLETYVFPEIGDTPVGEIGTEAVLKVLEPIWPAIPETASRVRQRIEKVLGWATVRGYREGENPARWRGHLDTILSAPGKYRNINHHSALPYAEMPKFMKDLRAREATAARALEFVIYTAARTGEVIGAKWEEISFETKTWTVPASRMKSRCSQRVPLTEPAIILLKTLRQASAGKFVFSGPKEGQHLSNMAMLTLLKRMGRADITVHGFRSTFRDWIAETTTYPGELAELALGHTIKDKVEAAYRRGDQLEKRRPMMDEWASYCNQKLKIEPKRKSLSDPIRSSELTH